MTTNLQQPPRSGRDSWESQGSAPDHHCRGGSLCGLVSRPVSQASPRLRTHTGGYTL
jgi:hypothetical protein